MDNSELGYVLASSINSNTVSPILNNQLKLTQINNQLIEMAMSYMPHAGDYPTQIDGLTLFRRNQAYLPEDCIYKPAIVILLQGAKHTALGINEYDYKQYDCLLTGIDMPSVNYVTEASEEKPFLGLVLSLDKFILTQLMTDTQPALPLNDQSCSIVDIAPVTSSILEIFTRLIGLLHAPEHIHALAPLYIKEIYYHLLIGAHGDKLQLVCTHGSKNYQISQSVTWLKTHFNEPLSIDLLAQQANMSVPTFHRHFKQVTSLSPLQYQKRLRLHEARRLMLLGDYNASRASLTVGYESFTQFNREYKRLFGLPPHQDVQRMVNHIPL